MYVSKASLTKADLETLIFFAVLTKASFNPLLIMMLEALRVVAFVAVVVMVLPSIYVSMVEILRQTRHK